MTNDEWAMDSLHLLFVIRDFTRLLPVFVQKADFLYKFSAPGVYGMKL
jgi:hypothetical protein